MNVISSYKVKIKDMNHCFNGTIYMYQEAISFFMDVCRKEWSLLQNLSSLKSVALMEKLTLVSENAHLFLMTLTNVSIRCHAI